MAEFDDLLSSRIHDAYDRVQLSETAKEGMLAALEEALAANTADEASSSHGTADAARPFDEVSGAAAAPSADSFTATMGDAADGAAAEPRASQKRSPRVLRFVLPAAACVAVALVAGTIAFQLPSNQLAGDSLEYAELAPEEPLAAGQSQDAAADQALESASTSVDAEEYASPSVDAEEFGSASEDASEDFLAETYADEDAMATGEAEEGTSWSDATGKAQGRQPDDLRDATIRLASGDELRFDVSDTGELRQVDPASVAQYLESAIVEGAGPDPLACEIYLTYEGDYVASLAGEQSFYAVKAAS